MVRVRHVPLTDAEIAQLRAAISRRLTGEADVQSSISRLIVDLLAVRGELRRERERALAELERLHDVLGRTRPYLVRRAPDEELEALLTEIEDALARRLL